MDPVTVVQLADAVKGLLHLSGQVVSRLYNYAQRVRKAPSEVEKLQRELVAFSNVLHSLNISLPHCGNLSIGSLLQEDFLKDTRQLFEKIENKIQLSKTFNKKRLKWPMTKNEVERYLTELERRKSTFSLVLNFAHWWKHR